jgi:hypothetical protein
MTVVAKAFIATGIALVIVGIVLLVSPKIPWLGRLPGDIFIQKKNVSFYFPITTCILISIVLTFVVYLVGRR